MDLRVRNEAKVVALVVGSFVLTLSYGLILSRKDFHILIKDKCCSIYINDVFYVSAPMRDGLYVQDLEMPIYNINAKRVKPISLNPAYLWHCHLGHIDEIRISKLHKDGLLDSFDFESIEVCKSCLFVQMTKAPFTSQGEKASNLLDLIYSYVCGPLNRPVRGGFS